MRYLPARASRLSRCRSASSGSLRPRMRAASQAALRAPASPIATQATGTPAGICTIEYRESTPPRWAVGTGTPITGRSVQAATTPGRWAAPPAAAITTLSPRPRALLAHSMTPAGLRCAEQTVSSASMPSSSSCRVQASISGRSDFEPTMIPTSGTYRLVCDVPTEVRSRKSYSDRSGEGGQSGLLHVRPQAHHGQHTAAAGDQAQALHRPGPGVEGEDVPGNGAQPLDDEAGLVALRVSAGDDHHADRDLPAPVQPGTGRQLAQRGRDQQGDQVRLQPGQDHLGLGVAEAGVELQHPDAVGGEH